MKALSPVVGKDENMTENQNSSQDKTQGRDYGKVDPKLLEVLACPLTKESLVYDREKGELISRKARLAFPIRDGIPIMLMEEARELTDEEVKALSRR